MKMKLYALIVTVGLLALTTSAQTNQPRQITFNWYGQACFSIMTPEGAKILIDPVNIKEYQVPKGLVADVVTISHNHFDHTAVDSLAGSPHIIWGKTRTEEDDAQKFIPVDTTVKGIRIYNVSSYHHDPAESPSLNAIFVYEIDSLRIVHLGDLGTILSADQIAKIGHVDVLMIPVGGKYTIWGATADSVVAQLKPTRAVIPMHFKTRVADFLPYSAEDFVKNRTDVVRIAGNEYVIPLSTPATAPKYIVFGCFE
jgi:L-ascorbate metabolism protein UlaG (beta-lactamase superfamily)